MSSRTGPRATGTDGSDFAHRERVASHYQLSVTYKSRLKIVCFLHFVLILLVSLKSSPSLLKLFSVPTPKWLAVMKLPQIESWEYVWIFSIQASIFCLFALRKNHALLLKQFIVGMIVFGFFPLGFAMYGKSTELMEYAKKGKVKGKLFGFPLVVLWYLFFTITVQLQAFGIYVAKLLLNMWVSKKTR